MGWRKTEKAERFRDLIRNVVFGSWNVIIVLLATFSSFTIPLELVTYSSPDDWIWQEIILTIFFTADIFITQFRLRHKQTAQFLEYSALRSYSRRWVLLDIVAAIPFASLTGVPWTALLRLAKLAKVIVILMVVRRANVRLNNPIMLFQTMYWAIIAAHALSCGWLLIRGLDHDIDIFSNYVAALYWTMATLTTVGYGDIVPVSNGERLYSAVTMILGYSLIGYLIGSVAGILTKKDPVRERYLDNLEKLANAVKYAQLPLDLQQRIHSYYTYLYDRRIGYDESSFIEELPEGLRAEASLHFRKEVIEQVSLFDEAPAEFILDIAPFLRERIVAPGDYVFRAGDLGKDMYLIARGKVGVYTPDELKLLATLQEGDYFGEIALFKEIPRTATVKAESYCDIYSLTKKTLDVAFQKYPSIAEVVRAKAEQRHER